MTQAFNLSQLANNLNTSGQLDATDGLVGVVPVANGGTGLSAVGTTGNVLTSNGTTWVSSTPAGGGFSGSTINTPSSSVLTLTNTSTQYQVVQITTTANNIVILPDATTIATEGFPPYVIENKSPTGSSLLVKNSAGSVIGQIAINGIGLISLVDNSTSAGQWRCSITSSQSFLQINANTLTTNTITGSYLGVLGLSATSFVRFSYNIFGNQGTSAYVRYYLQAGTISGSTITFGSVQSFDSTTYNSSVQVYIDFAQFQFIRLSNTAFVMKVGWVSQVRDEFGNSTFFGVPQFRTCTVSGTTITIGSGTSASMPTSNGEVTSNRREACAINGTLTRLSDTSFAVVYNDSVTGSYSNPFNYNGLLSTQIVTVSGATQTIGTKATLASSTYTQPTSIVAVSNTQLFVCYSQASSAGGSSGRTKLVMVGVSGTTATWNSPTTVESSDSSQIFSFLRSYDGAISPTSTQIIYNSGYNTSIASLSGTTLTYVSSPNSNLYPLYIASSTLAWTPSRYLEYTATGFVTITYTQINSSGVGVDASTPLGSQPTTLLLSANNSGSVMTGNTL